MKLCAVPKPKLVFTDKVYQIHNEFDPKRKWYDTYFMGIRSVVDESDIDFLPFGILDEQEGFEVEI